MIPALMNRKKAVTAILGGLHGEKEEQAGPGETETRLAIAQEVLRALEEKSAPALMEALTAFFASLEAEEHSEGV